jgi:hypothetical protein
MAEPVTTTVSTTLSTENTGGQILWETDDRAAAFAEQYVRLYGGASAVRKTTSGTLIGAGGDTSSHLEYLVFSGDTTVQLSHPASSGVSAVRQGSFFDKNGAAISPTVIYDRTTNSLVSSKSGYAVYKVTYDSSYELFRFRFSGGGCPTLATRYYDPNDYLISKYQAALLIAIDPAKGVATLNLDPPLCPSITFKTEKITPLIKLELDPDTPLRLGGASSGVPASHCDIRVYPAVSGVDVLVTAGSYSWYSTDYTLEVKETLIFSNSSSARLSYQPVSSVSARVLGTFTDQWNRTYGPDIKVPGDTFTEADWSDTGSYTPNGSRTVGVDEIVATTFGVAKPSYGTVEVTYTTTYRKFRYNFQFDTSRQDFLPVSIVANYKEQAFSLRLEVPGGGTT